MNITKIDLEKLYQSLNKKHFQGKLPYCTIRWYRKYTETVASIKESTRTIKLNPTYHTKRGINELKDTLLHEMIHLLLAENGKKEYHFHGKEFKKIAKRIGVKV